AGCHGPPAPAPAGEPELRIGLGVGLARVTLGGADGGELIVTEGGGDPIGTVPAGAAWTVVADSTGLRVVRPDGSRGAVHRLITAVNVSEGRFASANGRRYRGRLQVFRDRAGLTLVNRVPLESYVAGVVGVEMGPRQPNEVQAVLAQAVVSRTVGLRNRGRWESLGFDLWGDVRDQAYGGVGAEHPSVTDAVRRTAGEVIRYRGEVIDAFFHSTCGFSTAGLAEAFATSQGRPYLRPVSDANGRDRYYCDFAPHFRWRERWDRAELRAVLARTLTESGVVGSDVATGDALPRITDLRVTRTTQSGRVGELRIDLEGGRAVRIAASDVRRVLRPDTGRWLGSSAFQLEVARAGGEVSQVVAAGAGWGHGVGMCQWGAVGRARAGQDYRRILETYFPGTRIERAY
ncbi:MAG: SpoIID/LytB domain-containing protein, partial [Gemmatimonadales bacterium]